MLRVNLSFGVHVAKAAIGDAIGSARLMIELSVLVDFRSVVVRKLIHASLVVLSSVGVVNRDYFHAFSAGARLINRAATAVNDELNLQKDETVTLR
jgi:hypothetical protein